MNINETKRGIQTLDNGTTFGLSDEHLVSAHDLKALAKSHDELVKAAKAMRDAVNGAGGSAFKQYAYEQLEAAIEQAEGEWD